MTVQTIPDIEKVAGDYLRDHPDVDARVVGKPPNETNAAWVQVTQLDAPQDPVSPVDHLIAFLVQFDCYASREGIEGSTQREANVLGATVRAALIDMPGNVEDCVVTSARIVGDSRVPDTGLKPARDRRILTARIHAHG